MKKIEYLYGIKKATWLNVTYIDALEQKILLAQKLIDELQCSHYMERDVSRINDIQKAISFNATLRVE